MPRLKPQIQLIFLLLFMAMATHAQTREQKSLEAKRARIQKEIKEINRLLFAEKKEKGTVLDQMDALDRKINMSQELIRVTNQQTNLLNRQINANVRKLAKLREDLTLLKDDYATLIQKSYQQRSQQNRLMFLLSSKDFFQAFKRLQYMKQYADHRKKQGEAIVKAAEDLKRTNTQLIGQRKIKEQLLADNKRVKDNLFKQINTQKELLRSIRQNESKYVAEIDKKKREARRIDREIEKLIRSAIASTNKKSGSADKNSFSLTPEAKLIANNFSSNRGKLIWPVEKGIKSQGFGKYKDKVYPGIIHQNNGVTISTDKDAVARAIFEGEVIEIMTMKTGQKGVYVRHGNYISMYYNLAEVFVKKGDKIAAKEALGKIYTSKFDGATKLKFYLYQDTKKLNPEDWVYQL